MDIGSGAGLPGIPISIISESKINLIDSSYKRVHFLDQTIQKLNLKDIKALNLFLGNHKKSDYPKGDLIVFRAFRKPLISLELALYAAKNHSKMLYWHTNKLEKNVKDFDEFQKRITEMGYDHWEYYSLDFPKEYGERGVYLFEFHKKEDSMYPRALKKIEKDSFVSSFT